MFIPPNVKKENPSTVSLVINNITIDSSISLTILGVTISFDLNWNCHIDHVAKKVSSKTGALRRFGHSLNSCTRQRLHNTFLLPHFLYCISVWGNCSKFAEHQLDRSMKRCKRFILNCKDAELLASDWAALHVTSFSSLCMFHNIQQIHKLIFQADENNSISQLSLSLFSSTTRASQGKKLASQISRSCCDNCFYYSAPKQRNNVPNNITMISNFNSFCTNVSKHIFK